MCLPTSNKTLSLLVSPGAVNEEVFNYLGIKDVPNVLNPSRIFEVSNPEGLAGKYLKDKAEDDAEREEDERKRRYIEMFGEETVKWSK